MKKNILTALVLSALMVSAGASAATRQLNVWEDIKKSAGIKDAVAAFEKQYDVKVNMQEMPFAQQLEKLRLDGPAGIGPDVLVIPNDQLGGAVVQGLLSPLTLDKKQTDAFTPSSVAAFRMDNAQYGVPKAVETLVLIYSLQKPTQRIFILLYATLTTLITLQKTVRCVIVVTEMKTGDRGRNPGKL